MSLTTGFLKKHFTYAFLLLYNLELVLYCINQFPKWLIESQLNDIIYKFAYILVTGTILAITVPALYSRFEEQVDRCCGLIHNKLSQQYKIVDDNVISRIPGTLSKQKDT